MEEKKTSILALLKILEEYSDESHLLTRNQITDLLEEKYNLKVDRRTLYRNIEMLIDFGYDIETYSDNNKGYFLRERQFENSEVLLLCNAVHASHFIPDKSSNELVAKLLATQSKYKKNEFNKNVYLHNKKKKDNKQFFYNIEQISKAIDEHKVIKFYNTCYNLNKKLVKKREEPYYRSPYYLVVNGDRVYMIGKGENHTNLSHFRVDRMTDIEIVDKPYIKLPKMQDAYSYIKNRIYMYSGDETRVVLRCDLSVLDCIIDSFGKDITLVDEKDSFLVYAQCGKEDIKKFVLQYSESVELLEPNDLREEVGKILLDAANKYQR